MQFRDFAILAPRHIGEIVYARTSERRLTRFHIADLRSRGKKSHRGDDPSRKIFVALVVWFSFFFFASGGGLR